MKYVFAIILIALSNSASAVPDSLLLGNCKNYAEHKVKQLGGQSLWARYGDKVCRCFVDEYQNDYPDKAELPDIDSKESKEVQKRCYNKLGLNKDQLIKESVLELDSIDENKQKIGNFKTGDKYTEPPGKNSIEALKRRRDELRRKANSY